MLKYPTPHLKLYFLLTARQDDVFPAREEIPDSVSEFRWAAAAAWFRLPVCFWQVYVFVVFQVIYV